MTELTKNDIIRWYLTSILPSCGTAALNVFMHDINRTYDALRIYPDGTPVGIIYENLSKAIKAFDRYGFGESDFVKMGLPNPRTDTRTQTLKSFRKDNPNYRFFAFRHPTTANDLVLMK